jgi:beta-phosphoglucomutase-like phosphatase (HAD superfamily)
VTQQRALLLDLDGTLAESLQVMRLAYEALLRENGGVPTDQEFCLLNGPRLIEGAAWLRETHGWNTEAATIVARWLALIEEAYCDVKPTCGAVQLLSAARAAGWRIAVVTSGPDSLAKRWLARVGLSDLVDTVVGGDAVQKGKPDPAPYAEAMKRLGATPSLCIAVEDTPAGAASAAAAGARTFALAGGAGEFPAGAERIDALLDLLPVVAR